MNVNLLIKYGFQFIILIFLQVFIFQKIYLTTYCIPYFYSMLILLLPVHLNRYIVLIIGFLMGLIMDMFYHTGGIHAAAMSLLAYIRYYWLKIIEPSERYEDNQLPVVSEMNRDWFLKYTLPLLFVFHTSIFLLEAFSMRYFFAILIRSVLSTLVAEVILYYLHLLFFRPKQ